MKLHWMWSLSFILLAPFALDAQDLAQNIGNTATSVSATNANPMPDTSQVWVEFSTAAGPITQANAVVFSSSHLTVKVCADSNFVVAHSRAPRFTMRNILIYTAENSSQEPRLIRTIASTGTTPIDIHVSDLGVHAGTLVSIQIEEVCFVDQYANAVPLTLAPNKRSVRFRVF